MNKPRLLCVDDEKNVLESLRLNLKRKFDITCALGGPEALKLLEEAPEPYAVILSDMKMPEMTGAQFLSLVREKHPESVRMLLTGYSEMDSAISAVNDGGIFRFLTKPVDNDTLVKALFDGVELYQLRKAEEELLEQTLRGSVQAMAETLALANPTVFGRINSLKRLIDHVASKIKGVNRWELELVATLSQLGWASVPDEVALKYRQGLHLKADEQKMIRAAPRLSLTLVQHIPRLEKIRQSMEELHGFPAADELSTTSVLRVLLEYEQLLHRGHTPGSAFSELNKGSGSYCKDTLYAIKDYAESHQNFGIQSISVSGLKEDMILVDDLVNRNGLMLMAKGTRLNRAMIARLLNISDSNSIGMVKVEVTAPEKSGEKE